MGRRASPFTQNFFDYAPNNGLIFARQDSNKIPAITPYELTIAGAGGVPTSGANAVWLNVTATETEGGGFATVYPCASPRPLASNLNYGNRATVPNAVLAPVDVNGKVCLYAQQDTHFVVDVAGWFA